MTQKNWTSSFERSLRYYKYASMAGVYMVPICIFELVPAENGSEIRVNIAIFFQPPTFSQDA